MSEQEVKTLIYNALESGLKPDEIISKHNLSNYKRNVQGCYTWFVKNGSKMKKQEPTPTETYIEKTNDEMKELSMAFDTIVSFANKLSQYAEQQGMLDQLLDIVGHKFEGENLTNEQVLKCYNLTKDIKRRRRAVKQKLRVAQSMSSGTLADFTVKATKAKSKINSIMNTTDEAIANHYENKTTNQLSKYQNRFIKDYLEALSNI